MLEGVLLTVGPPTEAVQSNMLIIFTGPPPDDHPWLGPRPSLPTPRHPWAPDHDTFRDTRRDGHQGSGPRHSPQSSSSDRAFQTAPMYQPGGPRARERGVPRQSPPRRTNYQSPAIEDYLSTRSRRPDHDRRETRLGVGALQGLRRGPRGMTLGPEGDGLGHVRMRYGEDRRNRREQVAGAEGRQNSPRLARKDGSIHDEGLGGGAGWGEVEGGDGSEPGGVGLPPGDLGDPAP